jgi:hypothetical protein
MIHHRPGGKMKGFRRRILKEKSFGTLILLLVLGGLLTIGYFRRLETLSSSDIALMLSGKNAVIVNAAQIVEGIPPGSGSLQGHATLFLEALGSELPPSDPAVGQYIVFSEDLWFHSQLGVAVSNHFDEGGRPGGHAILPARIAIYKMNGGTGAVLVDRGRVNFIRITNTPTTRGK